MLRSVQLSLIVLLLLSCSDKKEKVENIIIIDVADFGRETIAKQVLAANSLNPKVIAIDLQFSTKKDTVADSFFADALRQCKNLVMVSVINEDYDADDTEYTLTRPIPEFLKKAKTGFANFVFENDELRTLKRFPVYEKIAGETEYSFGVRVAMAFDSSKTLSFIDANDKVVDVDFAGGSEVFKIYPARSILDNKIEREDIEGKIVLFGSFSLFDRDIFYTPLNKAKTPKQPDMFGVVFHANVISQIINQ